MPRIETPSDRDMIQISRPILDSPRVSHESNAAGYTGTCNVHDVFGYLASGVEALEGSHPDWLDLLNNTWVDISGSFVRDADIPGGAAYHTGTHTMAMAGIDCFDDWSDGVCGGAWGGFTLGTGTLAGTQRDIGYFMRRSDDDYILAFARVSAATEEEITWHIEVYEAGQLIQSVASEAMPVQGMSGTNLWVLYTGNKIVINGGPDSDDGWVTQRCSLLTDKFVQNLQYGLYFNGETPSTDVYWTEVRIFGAPRDYRIPIW